LNIASALANDKIKNYKKLLKILKIKKTIEKKEEREGEGNTEI
jgi:hypothetical protein